MKILLVEDNLLFRAGMRLLLSSQGQGFEVSESGTCDDALSLIANEDVRVCLVNPNLHGKHGGKGIISRIRVSHFSGAVVALSEDESAAAVRKALDEGAMGYIPKSVTPEILMHALNLVLAGGMYLPPSLVRPPLSVAAAPLHASLTRRQLQILECLMLGWPNKEISRHLNLSENTIKTHLASLYRALKVNTRSQAINAARAAEIRSEPETAANASPHRKKHHPNG